jgi:hypothetical protein
MKMNKKEEDIVRNKTRGGVHGKKTRAHELQLNLHIVKGR